VPGPASPPTPPPAGASYGDRPWLASYPEGVPADYDFPEVPLTRLLDDAASSFPTRTALAFLGSTLTYRALKEQVDLFATALAGLGVGKGDRVAIVLPNCPQNVIAFFATLRLGAVAVQHNPLSTGQELRSQLSDCGATVVVCLDRVYDTVAQVRSDTAVRHVVVTSLADPLPPRARLALRLPLARTRRARAQVVAAVPKGAPVERFAVLLKAARSPARQVPVDVHADLALLLYTGGTTGASKGVMLTHANLVSNAYMNRLWDTGATAGEEVALGVLPLFSAYGLTVCLTATVLLGGTLVLLPRFDLDQLFDAVDTWRPTMLAGVPPIFKAVSESPRARTSDLSSLRLCVSGAMRLPVEVQEQFERVTGARLVEGYGLTETSPSTHCNPVSGLRKPGSIGVPLPGTSAKIVDQDDARRELPVGEAGELAVAGPQVCLGYWGRAQEPGLFGDDGYLLTGDVAVMDQDGFFTVVDRKKDLIISGGFNVFPSEVEEVLHRLPGVAEAVVVGVPDRFRGETVKAYVVPEQGAALTADDVVAHCSAALTAYKLPRLVEFREDLPRTDVGKVLRRALVEQERARAAAAPGPHPGAAPAGSPGKQAPTPPAAAAQPVTSSGGQEPPNVPEPLPTPAHPGPVEPARAERAPVEKAPARKAAVKKAAVKKAPARKAPARKAAVKKAPVDEPQVEQPVAQPKVQRPPGRRVTARPAPVGRTAPTPSAEQPPAEPARQEPAGRPPAETPAPRPSRTTGQGRRTPRKTTGDQ
jgi:long-chain acyl-CoA synthetase